MIDKTTLQQKIKNRLTVLSGQKQEEQIVEAQQIISEKETIDSFTAFSLVQRRIEENNKFRPFIISFSRVAAVLFIPLLIASGWLFYRQLNPVNSVQYAMQEITSPSGVRSQVVLPDGTKVWLNAESRLQFQVPFSGASRNVGLVGEAFFDVTPNKKVPFVVETGNVKVKVLGTRFNCKSYAGDENITVALEEGKVALNISGNSGIEEKVMKPGDYAVIQKGSAAATVSNEEISKYIAWHTGKLVFSNTPMSEVAQLLERWYGIDVVIKDQEIMDYRFTTTFDNESLFQVIELLGLSSPIRIQYVPATLGKDNISKTKSQIILSKK